MWQLFFQNASQMVLFPKMSFHPILRFFWQKSEKFKLRKLRKFDEEAVF